ncbi:MAG: hypothetical protein ACO3JL_08720 [Myxococcota bacterium]
MTAPQGRQGTAAPLGAVSSLPEPPQIPGSHKKGLPNARIVAVVPRTLDE